MLEALILGEARGILDRDTDGQIFSVTQNLSNEVTIVMIATVFAP